MSHSLLRPLIRKHVITILLVSFLGFLPGCQDLEGYKEDRPAQIRVQGTLTRVAAIGGETTGWGIELDEEKLAKYPYQPFAPRSPRQYYEEGP